MPKKDEKNQPSMKSQKDDKKVGPDKEPQSKPPVEKRKEDQIQDDVALQEAKERVTLLETLLVKLRSQIEAERREGSSDPSILQAQVNHAKMKWDRIQSDLGETKGLSRKRKDEIDGWKAWYENRSNEEKPVQSKKQQREADLDRLQKEIKWRADELASNGEKFNTLIPQEFEARGVYEMASQKLAAFQTGVYKRPIEEDPRLKSLQEELREAVADVEKLEREKPKKK